MILKLFLDLIEERLEVGRSLLVRLLLGLLFSLIAEGDVAAGDIHKLLAFKLTEGIHKPFIHGIDEEEHVETMLLRLLKLGSVACILLLLGAEEVDVLLVLRHLLHIVRMHAFLQNAAEGLEEGVVGILLLHVFER